MIRTPFKHINTVWCMALWMLVVLLPKPSAAIHFSYEVGGELREIYDDNIFLESAAVSDDFITEIGPEVKLVLESLRFSASVSYAPRFSIYAGHFDDDRLQEIAQALLFDTAYQISPRFIFQLSDRYSTTSATEGRPAFSKVDVYQNNELRIYPTYTYEFSERSKLALTPAFNRRDIETLNTDYLSYGGEIAWSRLLDSYYRLFISNAFERRQYDDLNEDFFLYTVYLTLGIDISRRLEASIPVGYQLFMPDGNDMHHNYSYQVKIKYFITPRLVFEPEFSQIYTADLSGNPYESRVYGGRLQYEFSPRLLAKARAEFRDFNYFNTSAASVGDNLLSLEGTLSYEVSERSTILFNYERADNGGEDQTDDFAVNRYALEFQYRYGTAK